MADGIRSVHAARETCTIYVASTIRSRTQTCGYQPQAACMHACSAASNRCKLRNAIRICLKLTSVGIENHLYRFCSGRDMAGPQD